MVLFRGKGGRLESFTYRVSVVVLTESVGDFVPVVGRPHLLEGRRLAYKYVRTAVGAGGTSPVTQITVKTYPTVADSNNSYASE